MPKEKIPTAFDAYLHVAGTISVGLDEFLKGKPPIIKSRKAWANEVMGDVNALNNALKFLRKRNPKLKKDLDYIGLTEELAIGFTYAQQAVKEYSGGKLTNNDEANYMGLRRHVERVRNGIEILTGKYLPNSATK